MFAGKINKGYVGPKNISYSLTHSGQIEKGSDLIFNCKMEPVSLVVEIYEEVDSIKSFAHLYIKIIRMDINLLMFFY